jgi:hypothetical protein
MGCDWDDSGKSEKVLMIDALFVGIVVLFFVVAGYYVRLCEKL